MLKAFARKMLNTLHLDLTKNLEYDRLTQKIIKQVVTPDTVCIDVGCHKGEILDLFLKCAPEQKHYAFEPIPQYFKQLKAKYPDIKLFPYALSDREGHAAFQFVKNAPAYSGLKKRTYDIANPDIEQIEVQLKRLDEIIENKRSIGLIKIDVEGAEFQVLNGAKEVIKQSAPYIIFEFGLGAADHYNTSPEQMHDLINGDLNLKINTLKGFTSGKNPVSENQFKHLFASNEEYYFIASK